MAWPIDTTALLMVACIFICREIEVAGALEFEFCVHEDGDSCSFRLPATKCPQQRRAEKPEASQGQSSAGVTSNDSEPLGSSWASIMMPHLCFQIPEAKR